MAYGANIARHIANATEKTRDCQRRSAIRMDIRPSKSSVRYSIEPPPPPDLAGGFGSVGEVGVVEGVPGVAPETIGVGQAALPAVGGALLVTAVGSTSTVALSVFPRLSVTVT